MKKHSHPSARMDCHGAFYQIGRLLFPDLINRQRAMRFRMTLVTAMLGLITAAGTITLLLKVNNQQGRTIPVYAKPLKQPN